jgi:elongation factor Ts
MTEISASIVSKLREMTGAGLMNCKQALMETGGDIEKAVELLRKKGVATAAKKSMRDAREGIIAYYISPDSTVGVLIEVNCETDFVAKNEQFKAFAADAARRISADPKVDLEPDRVQLVARTGENVRIQRFERWQVSGNGLIAAYIHTGSKIGVLVEVGAGKTDSVANEQFKELVKDITLQIAAASPLAVSRDGIDPKIIEKEKEIAREQVKNKPPQAIEKIVAGKIEKFYQTYCLLEQGFVKQPDISVKDHIAAVAKNIGDEITIRRFLRYQVGESVGA